MKSNSEERLKLLEIFVLAQMLDLLSTLVAILFFGGRELNPVFSGVYYLIFAKSIATLILTNTLININPSHKILKGINIFVSIPVFLNTIQIVLEVL